MKRPAKWLLLLTTTLVACAGTAGVDPNTAPGETAGSPVPARTPPPIAEAETAPPPAEEAAPGSVLAEEYLGSGSFINAGAAASGAPRQTEGDIVLNFEGSDLKEIVKSVLGDMLGVGYSIDPAVAGVVTLQTSRPISRDSVLPTLETLLRANGAALVKSGALYLVVPEAKARVAGVAPTLRPRSDQGFQYLVVPLQYLAAAEMEKILEPILPGKSSMQVDARRNILILAGSSAELESLLQTVRIFDVDQMQGMSVGLYRLQTVDAKTVGQELEQILGEESAGPLAGMVRFVVVDRLNALIVITPQPTYLQTARTWIERLDRAEESGGRNMYVYHVENGRAENVAALLQQLLGGETAPSGSGPRSPSPTRAADAAGAVVEASPAVAVDLGNVKIVADEENNTLLILASREDYNRIRSAIRQVDQVPMQVLVEASIIEVTLTNELSYGLQWFFKNSIGDFEGRGEIFPLTVDPSFSYTLTDASGMLRAVLKTLAADGRLHVVSSPSLMVLDNHAAIIKVGDQVPIRTSETTSLATSGDAPLITSTIQYRDTGVVLQVTPRVNAGGMVVLEVTQDVNDVDRTTTSAIDSPTIVQRQITTTVAVKSGQTVVLGGLMRENRTKSASGVPGLRGIPVIGWLFGSKTTTADRTELLVMITPTAIGDQEAARAVTEEMKRKMPALEFPP